MPAVVQTPPSLPMGHTEQPVSAIVPNLVLVQLLGQLPELLLQSLRSRNVVILDPSRSSHRIHVEDVSQRLAASGSLRSSSPVMALRALRRRSPSPEYDHFLQLGPFFFPNWSGIKVFGSTNRTRDLVSTILRRVLNSWCIAGCPAETRCSCSCSSWTSVLHRHGNARILCVRS